MTTKAESPADGRACFRIALGGKPDGAKLPVEARLTLTGGAAPVETRGDARRAVTAFAPLTRFV